MKGLYCPLALPVEMPCQPRITPRTPAFVALVMSGGRGPQAALQRSAHAAIGSLLQLMDEASDQQIATEARRRSGAMQLAPANKQLLRRQID